MDIKFVKETDKKNRTYIIEGVEKPGNVFSIIRFVCLVEDQGSNKETQEVADMLLLALNNYIKL